MFTELSFCLLSVLFYFALFFMCPVFGKREKESLKLEEWGVGQGLGRDEEEEIMIRIHSIKQYFELKKERKFRDVMICSSSLYICYIKRFGLKGTDTG